MSQAIFDQIIRRERKAWIIWEDDTHLAFLTPFPNTPGVAVVIPKINHGDYVFQLSEQQYIDLMKAAKVVAKILENAFNTSRIALVFEGTGVAHVHAKLYPLHGDLASQTNVWSTHTEFYPQYVGYITTVEGYRMSDKDLDELQQKILAAQKV